jgi:hypothetical protein
MVELHRRASDIGLADPAVGGVGASIGGSSWSGTVNNGIMFIALSRALREAHFPPSPSCQFPSADL